MSISMEYCYSGLVVARLFSKLATLVSVAVRWLLLPSHPSSSSSSSSSSADDDAGKEAAARHAAAAQAVRGCLRVTTYGEIGGAEAAAPAPAPAPATCAVCLSEVRLRDSVRELGSCAHVFHSGCLDRWLDHDQRLSCPLCRAPLLSQPARPPPAAAEQSWAVERLVYLFADDLLFSPAPYNKSSSPSSSEIPVNFPE